MSNAYLKSACTLALSALLLARCGSASEAPLLEGKINVTTPTEIAFVYDYEGETLVEEITTDSAGVFTFNPQLEGKNADIAIYIGHDIYGAFIEKGSATRLYIVDEKTTFEGDNIDRNQFNNIYNRAFSPWTFKPTPDHPFNKEEWTSNLNQGYEATMKAIANVKNEEARARYTRLADARKQYYTLQILSLDRMMNGAEHSAQTDSIIAAIDPNADETRLSGLMLYWYSNANIRPFDKGQRIDLAPYYISQFEGVDSALTNEANKRSLFYSLCDNFLMFQPSDSDITELQKGIPAQLAKAPRITERIQKVLDERAKRIKDGDALPSNPILIARDDSRTDLAKVIEGKVAYIDIWATWCVPCCREIPHMKKLYEKFKDNTEIVFVSISQDDNTESWQKKIDNDKPEWPNFIFDKKTGREFLDAMSIHSIPRFLLIGRDGKIISVDATRPSSQDAETILKAAIAK